MSDQSETQNLLSPKEDGTVVKHGFLSPYRKILFASFCLSVAFMTTQAPLVYAYRIFNCDLYYETHEPFPGQGDRCAIRAIESTTAASLSFMATLTTVSGFCNLILTRWYMARFGIRFALVMQTLFPCIRNLFQIWGLSRSGWFGIVIFQSTQLLTIFGGGLGYLLAANSYVAAVVEPEERTAAFGILQGMAMLGTAVGFTFGGLFDKWFGKLAPFQVTFCILVSCCFLTGFGLPYIAPAVTESEDDAAEHADGKSKKKKGGMALFFKPLRVFAPRDIDGKRYTGATFLALGVAGSVLATQYVPMMLQLIATNLYGFHPTENGYLMASTAMSRAIFLTLGFPRIIKTGRSWYSLRYPVKIDVPPTIAARPDYGTITKNDGRKFDVVVEERAVSSSNSSDTQESPAAGDLIPRGIEEEEIVPKHEVTASSHQSSQFDLIFLRWSIFVDAILTACCAFASKGWHIYLAAVILPLASGTAPAAKGVIMEMVLADQRPDALSAIALVETAATIGTLSAFGSLFAHLSAVGKPNLVFVFNGALAFVAFCIFLFARLPGSRGTRVEV